MRVPAESGTNLESETADHEREPVRPTNVNDQQQPIKRAAEVAAVDKEKPKK